MRVCRWRLAAVRTVGAQLAAKISDLLLQGDILQPKPGILCPQLGNLTSRFAKFDPRQIEFVPYLGQPALEACDQILKGRRYLHPHVDSYNSVQRNKLHAAPAAISMLPLLSRLTSRGWLGVT